ncbi:putative bicaudal D-related protein 2-like [Triplophysa rosa]|uniref:Bicaudal D-related protein 2-like n=1 Tax=Triplophysa rosa TaxID=992332 RepID=A0A9W7WHS0_TRIRA|nr:putative bicaudal D-related protein 2-like [Triplophysa rosa]
MAFQIMMNWHHELSSILSDTDGSVAKMRERLSARARSPRATEAREGPADRDLKVSSSVSPAVHWSDLTAVQNQLHQQSQAIETLTQSVRSLEREGNAQQTLIQTLQDELRRLQVRLEEREREVERTGADRRLEQWKRDVNQELSSLREHINRVTITETQEGSFSSKLRREELEHIRRETDSLKNKLMRLEEDGFQLQSENRETRRQHEHSSKMLERLSDCQRTHRFEVTRTLSQHKHTQQQVCELRVSVSELKDEVRGLILRDVHNTPAQLPHKQAVESSPSRRMSSGSEDEFSLTASLAEISSDESWLEEADTQTKSRGVHISSGLSGSDLSGAGSDLDDGAEGVDGGSNSPPDLSLSDL